MAYYAELRGGLALLASQGILVINRRLFALNAAGQLLQRDVGAGTHVSVWELYDRWSESTEATATLRAILLPFGLPLGDWLDAAAAPPLGLSSLAAGRDWLKRWALDLQQFTDDKRLRAKFSYNPTGFEDKPAFAPEPYVCQTWTLLEPGGPDPFERLDRHLLRAIIEKVVHDGGLNLVATLGTIVGALPMAPPIPDAVAFLGRAAGHEHDAAVMRFARDRTTAPWSTMARAVVLLRLATGAVRLQLDAAGVPRGSFADWADQVAEERRLWDLGPVDSPVDLWGDVDLAVEHMATCPEPLGDTDSSLRVLETGERVALWSLAA